MSSRKAIRMLRLPLASLVVACAFTCSAGAARSASLETGAALVAHCSVTTGPTAGSR